MFLMCNKFTADIITMKTPCALCENLSLAQNNQAHVHFSPPCVKFMLDVSAILDKFCMVSKGGRNNVAKSLHTSV